MLPLHEQERPHSWDDICGQDDVVRKLRAVGARGFGSKALWLSGGSGTGKTTIARIVCASVAGDLATHEENARDIDLDYVRQMERTWNTSVLPSPGSDKTGRAWIFNESHNLRASVCERMLTTLEMIPDHCVIVFTTTTDAEQGLFEGYDNAPAFMSRHLKFKLARRGIADAFAERAQTIATKAGLNGKPIASYKRLAMDHGNNLRSMIQAIEAGAMLGDDA